MGEVYRARDTKLSREVAIKVLPAELAGDAHRLERFEKEARTASALNHPNIVTIYEIGTRRRDVVHRDGAGRGKDAARASRLPAPLPSKRLLALAAQMADGLAKAHAAGIVHRDLKPENLMVTRDGFVKILDFGLAKLVPPGLRGSGGHGPPTMTRGTEAGTVLGTVGYMSPEQASGEPLDFRSDQFSLGSILYEMAAGRRAFERPTPAQTLSAIIEAEPEPLPELAPKTPTNLVWIVERCLAKDPEDRYGSTKDLARDLAAMRDHSSGISVSGVAPPAARRLRLSRADARCSALAVAGRTVLAFFAGRRVQARRDRETPPPRPQSPHVSSRLSDGRALRARRADDRVFGGLGREAQRDLHDARRLVESRPLGIFPAGILSVSSAGEMAISLGCENRWEPCFGRLARAPLAGGTPRESPRRRRLGRLVAGRQGARRDPRRRGARPLEYPIGKVLYQSGPIGFLTHVRVSPDGERVAFLDHPRRESDRGLVTVVDRAGQKKVLTTEWARLAPILWSPTNDEVFFTPWAQRGTRGVRLSGETRNASWIHGLDDVSREGRFLGTGILSEDYRGNIRALVPGSAEECNLSWLGGSVVSDLSSDGKQLLLYEETRHPDRPGEEMFTSFLRPTDGSDAMLLGEGRALALSPDKQWALVARTHPETHLVLLPTVAGEPRRLEGGGLMYRRAQFFPDGKRIVFVADPEMGDIRGYIQSVEGGPPKELGEGFRPVIVSPDGTRFVGWSDDGLFLVRTDGGAPPRPVPGDPRGFPSVWSADGRAIYTYEETDKLTLYRLDLATGRGERLKELSPPDKTGFVRYGSRPVGMGFAVTPDGRYYAYSYFTDQNHLTLTEGGPDWWK